MNKNVKLFGCTVILLVAISACETDTLDPDPIPVPVPDPKLLYNEMILAESGTMQLVWLLTI